MVVDCTICGKSYATEAGLNMHKGHQHKPASEKKPEKKRKPAAKPKLVTLVLEQRTVDLLVEYALEKLLEQREVNK